MRNNRIWAPFAQYAKFRLENRRYFLFCDDILLRIQGIIAKYFVEALAVM